MPSGHITDPVACSGEGGWHFKAGMSLQRMTKQQPFSYIAMDFSLSTRADAKYTVCDTNKKRSRVGSS